MSVVIAARRKPIASAISPADSFCLRASRSICATAPRARRHRATQPVLGLLELGLQTGGMVAAVSVGHRAPILLRLPPDRRRGRVLELEPVRRAAGAVARAEPLGDDALAAELAGVLEHRQPAVVLQVLVQAHAVAWLLRRMLASVALRVSIGSRRRSVPSSSSRSKA